MAKKMFVFTGSKGATQSQIQEFVKDEMSIIIPEPPTTDGTYVLKATVSGGVVTYSWVSA